MTAFTQKEKRALKSMVQYFEVDNTIEKEQLIVRFYDRHFTEMKKNYETTYDDFGLFKSELNQIFNGDYSSGSSIFNEFIVSTFRNLIRRTSIIIGIDSNAILDDILRDINLSHYQSLRDHFVY